MKPAWAGNGFPVDFEISVFKDNDWCIVYSVTDYKKPVDEAIQLFNFETVKTSRFKITVTKMNSEGGTYSVKLAEIMAYPFANGEEFDVHAVENVTSKTYEDALLVEDSEIETNADSIIEIVWLCIIVGAVFVVVSVVGVVFILIWLNKKNRLCS